MNNGGIRNKIKGIITAVATPFYEGELDLISFTKLVLDQIDQGINGFVINGTTGESPCLSQEEVKQLFTRAQEITEGKLPLILGVGSNSTKTAIKNIKLAENLKPTAVLVVVPYYNKPPQAGLIQHFKNVADASVFPVILYNVPGRTGVSLSIESIVELSQHPQICGIKEASGDLNLGRQILEKTEPEFILLSGDDESFLDLCSLGAQGVVSVVSHILGKTLLTALSDVKKTGNLFRKKEEYIRLFHSIYCQSNPIGIKMALYLMGIFRSGELRSPLISLDANETHQLKKILKELNLCE